MTSDTGRDGGSAGRATGAAAVDWRRRKARASWDAAGLMVRARKRRRTAQLHDWRQT